ncbi:hypothetical protein Droror1_Dr00018623 [Drosera rotundifolia]
MMKIRIQQSCVITCYSEEDLRREGIVSFQSRFQPKNTINRKNNKIYHFHRAATQNSNTRIQLPNLSSSSKILSVKRRSHLKEKSKQDLQSQNINSASANRGL